MRVIYLIFYIFLFSTTASANINPLQTPVSWELLQQARQDLLASGLASLTKIVVKLKADQADLIALTSAVQHQFLETQTKLQALIFKLILSLSILLLSIVCFFEEEGDQPKKKSESTSTIRTPPKLSEENDVRDEYNFMATKQAIPAKLDLARAYIDMGDVIAARATLLEVLVNGDETQIAKARGLLGSL